MARLPFKWHIVTWREKRRLIWTNWTKPRPKFISRTSNEIIRQETYSIPSKRCDFSKTIRLGFPLGFKTEISFLFLFLKTPTGEKVNDCIIRILGVDISHSIKTSSWRQQTSVDVIKRHMTSTNVIKRHQTSTNVNKRQQTSTNVIKRHQTSTCSRAPRRVYKRAQTTERRR